MRILIVDDLNSDDFKNLIQKQLIKKNTMPQSFKIIQRQITQLDEFFSLKSLYNCQESQPFNMIDIIFIQISQKKLPWDPKYFNINLLILLAIKCKKPFFGTGGILNFVTYLFSSNIENQINVLNGLNGSTVQQMQNYIKKQDININDLLLDNQTGYLYNIKPGQNGNEWYFHADTGMNIKNAFQNKQFSFKNLNINKSQNNLLKQNYINNEQQLICEVIQSQKQEQILQNIEQKFKIYNNCQWKFHQIKFASEEKSYKTLIQQENIPVLVKIQEFSYASQIKFEIKDQNTIQILQNYLEICFSNVQKFYKQTMMQNVISQNQNMIPISMISPQSNKSINKTFSRKASKKQNISKTFLSSKNLFKIESVQQLQVKDEFMHQPINSFEQNFQNKENIKTNLQNIKKIFNNKLNIGNDQSDSQSDYNQSYSTLIHKVSSQSDIRKALHPNISLNEDLSQEKEIVRIKQPPKYFRKKLTVNIDKSNPYKNFTDIQKEYVKEQKKKNIQVRKPLSFKQVGKDDKYQKANPYITFSDIQKFFKKTADQKALAGSFVNGKLHRKIND